MSLCNLFILFDFEVKYDLSKKGPKLYFSHLVFEMLSYLMLIMLVMTGVNGNSLRVI